MPGTILYISYDGILEPLGRSQVLQYLLRLSDKHRIILVSYEKPGDLKENKKFSELRVKVEERGIRWVTLRYHKRPTVFATSYDIITGFIVCAYLILRYRVKIIHARSYVPSVFALVLKKIFSLVFIFDMRGFWADEKVDAGLWAPGSLLYNSAKWFEKKFLANADEVVSLSKKGVELLREFDCFKKKIPRFDVIPTCTDLKLFKPSVRNKSRAPFTLGYVGTAGSWYLFAPVLECFNILQEQRPGVKMLIINRNEHAYISACLKAHGISKSCVQIRAVDYDEVGREMADMDAGIFFIKPVFSKKASAPTKLGEFLACGVPCLSNAGIGDTEEILEGEGVGVIIRAFNYDEYRSATHRLIALAESPEIKDRCLKAACRYFSLEKGVEAYDRIYNSFIKNES